MASPRDVVVRFLADTREFLRSTDAVEQAYEDIARDADTAADKGEDSARRLSRAYDRASDEMKRDARETGKATREGFGEAGKESGQEFSANLGGAISSGDFSSVAQETAGGLAATFGAAGPLGAAFAAVTAVGVGIFTSMQAAAEEAKQAAQGAFDELLSGADKEAKFRARLEELFGTYEDGLAQIARESEATGIPIQEIADALAEGGEPARKLSEHTKKIADDLLRAARGRGSGVTQNEVDRARELSGNLKRVADQTDRAALAEERRAEALRLSSKSYGGAYGVGGSMQQSQVGSRAGRYEGGYRG